VGKKDGNAWATEETGLYPGGNRVQEETEKRENTNPAKLGQEKAPEWALIGDDNPNEQDGSRGGGVQTCGAERVAM